MAGLAMECVCLSLKVRRLSLLPSAATKRFLLRETTCFHLPPKRGILYLSSTLVLYLLFFSKSLTVTYPLLAKADLGQPTCRNPAPVRSRARNRYFFPVVRLDLRSTAGRAELTIFRHGKIQGRIPETNRCIVVVL